MPDPTSNKKQDKRTRAKEHVAIEKEKLAEKDVEIPEEALSDDEAEENYGELFPHFRRKVPKWTMTHDQISRGRERAKIIKGNQKVTTLDEKAIQEAVARFDALVKDGKATVSIFKDI